MRYPLISQLQLQLHLTPRQQLWVQLQMMGFSQVQVQVQMMGFKQAQLQLQHINLTTASANGGLSSSTTEMTTANDSSRQP